MDNQESSIQYGIRFGLGAIKAVGIQMMEDVIIERKNNGNFKDIYDFAKRLDVRYINKKSIEALAKSGSVDSINPNRKQIFESVDIISSFAVEAKEEANSNQMNLFGSITDSDSRPALKNVSDWSKKQRLTSEFQAFGYFLNEHPIDNKINELKHRGVVFSLKLEEDELEDNSLIKLAGVVASSKHRSGSRGRFAYLNISDPFGIYEVTIFDEALITANRDLIEDGCEVVIECLYKKDDGGTRIMVKNVYSLDDYIQNNISAKDVYEDIKIIPQRKDNYKNRSQTQNEFTQNNKNPNQQNNKFQNKNSIEKNDSNSNEINNIKTISEINIGLNNINAILPLKTILSQKKSMDGNAFIYLIAHENNKKTKILLSEKYKILEIDIFRLKNLNPNITIEEIKY